MRRMLVLLLVPLLGVPVSLADTSVPAGPVSGLWSQSGSPYLIHGDVSIPLGEELIVEPGCLIVFTDHYELRILGRLVAEGTDTENIVFEAGNPSVGWQGMRFVNTTANGQEASLLTHCILQGGRAVGSLAEDKDGGAIQCVNSADVILRHCTLTGNYADDEGGALYLGAQSNIRVEDSQFIGNEAWFSGGAIHCAGSSPVIVNSTIDSNESTVFAGGIAAWNGSHFRMENVRVINCVAGAVCGFYSVASSPEMVGCLLAGNTSTLGNGGGGGLTSNSHVRLINTTIAGNSVAQGGAGVWVYVSTIEITNSIIWANQPDAISRDSGSTVTVTYSDIEGGWPGIGNLDLAPEFAGGDPHPYALGELSPCIDAANPDTTGLGLPETDLAGNPRIAGGLVDMGGYEYAGAGGAAWPEIAPAQSIAMRCAPNPCRTWTMISYDLPAAAPVTLRICDIAGRQIRTLLNHVQQPSREHHVPWDGRSDLGAPVPSGTYLYVLTAGSERVTIPVMLLR